MNYKEFRTLLFKRFNIPQEQALRKTLKRFTIAEKLVFFLLVGVFIFSSIGLLYAVSNSFLVEIPTRGGRLTEGVVGNPRFVNPVLAISEADRNLVALVYSGLVRVMPNGEIENDLAENITISENGRTYTARIRDDATFHDGKPVTADDVIFTIQKISDPLVKSPRRGDWDGVTVSKVDEKTVSFALRTAYAPFIYNLATGILPKEIWNNVTADEFAFSQFNTLPIGSGPYLVDRVERNDGGIPDYYRLAPFEHVIGKKPYISTLIFRFYPSEEALLEAYKKGDVDSFGGVTAEETLEVQKSDSKLISSPLPRVFAVFFNQSESSVLANKSVRRALDLSAPKEAIVEKVLGGYGTAIDGPFPAGLFEWSSKRNSSLSYEERLSVASGILSADGWKRQEGTGVLEKGSSNARISLSFSISTGDAPELKAVAEELVLAWRDLGANVTLSVYETGDLNQNIIRPRNYETLLFGEVIGRDGDVYPFWHSSQRNDPGLNIALYTNSRADKLLTDARSASDRPKAEESYKAFDQEIRNDVPAIFLYTPSYIYLVPEKIRAISIGSLSSPQDRFLSIREWYVETDRVWKIFTR